MKLKRWKWFDEDRKIRDCSVFLISGRVDFPFKTYNQNYFCFSILDGANFSLKSLNSKLRLLAHIYDYFFFFIALFQFIPMQYTLKRSREGGINIL